VQGPCASVRTRRFGALGEVSALTLGGGGIGKVWGSTDRREAVATVEAAVAAGINLVDVAPGYGTEFEPREAERVVGEAFDGTLPAGVRVVTKVGVDDAAPGEIRRTVRESLEESLRLVRLERVDVFLHHSYLRPERIPFTPHTLALSLYREVLRPEFEALREEGLIGAWGLTATGHPEAVFAALAEDPRPQVVQVVTNLLDSPGGLWTFGEHERPDNAGTRRRAAAAGIGVMAIRAVQAGALTDALDRELPPDDPDRRDFDRAAGFRALAARRGESAAFLAHRYALSLDHVDTVVLGVKNRIELDECVAAEEAGPLAEHELRELESSVGLA
jgi:aryl-alcohol dehydrogenase-like predicted oxidoreductase